MFLLPAKKGTCPKCAVDHAPHEPHDATSLYFQYAFYGEFGRFPTWKDAISHCSPEVKTSWEIVLKEKGHWTEPNESTTD